jgi:hypothetical protein
MSNISIKLNLKQLKHVQKTFKSKKGKKVECLVIPIVENDLFSGEKGVYLDLTAFEIKNKVGDSKDTHLIKQSLKKELYESMTDEQKHAMPVMGNLVEWARQESAPQVAQSIAMSDEDEDDLPF